MHRDFDHFRQYNEDLGFATKKAATSGRSFFELAEGYAKDGCPAMVGIFLSFIPDDKIAKPEKAGLLAKAYAGRAVELTQKAAIPMSERLKAHLLQRSEAMRRLSDDLLSISQLK